MKLEAFNSMESTVNSSSVRFPGQIAAPLFQASNRKCCLASYATSYLMLTRGNFKATLCYRETLKTCPYNGGILDSKGFFYAYLLCL